MGAPAFDAFLVGIFAWPCLLAVVQCQVPGVFPPTPVPVDNVRELCAATTCFKGSPCRVVLPCDEESCVPKAACLDLSNQPGIDDECKRQGYLEVLLVGAVGGPGFSQLKCRGPLATRDCPLGSVCVDDLKGGGTCCTGKPDPTEKPGFCPNNQFSVCGGIFCEVDNDCPDNQKCCDGCGRLCTNPVPDLGCGQTCQEGETCVQRPVDCEPGLACIQALVPTCVPDACANCSTGQECRKVPNLTQCAAGLPCPEFLYFCALKGTDECGRFLPCPQGQRCGTALICASQEAPLTLATSPPAEATRGKRSATSNIFDPFCDEVRVCLPDECGGCPSGQKCEPTGIVCVTTPCPSHRCVPDDPCGGCPGGQTCVGTGAKCETSPCKTHTCVPDDNCQGCDYENVCKLVFPPCAPPPPCDVLRELNPNAECIEPDCSPVPTCMKPNDFDTCGSVLCPSGTRCQMEPFGSCPEGVYCDLKMVPRCVQNCPLRCGPNQKCELSQTCRRGGGCSSEAKCVSIPCPLKCDVGYQCQFTEPKLCPPLQLCDVTEKAECVLIPTTPRPRKDRCPPVASRSNSARDLFRCWIESLRSRRCSIDDDCGTRQKCCLSNCNRKICRNTVRSGRYRFFPFGK